MEWIEYSNVEKGTCYIINNISLPLVSKKE